MFWLLILLFVATIGLAYALQPAPPNNGQKPAGLSDLTAPTAEVGRAVPVLFGTRDLLAPNVCWYGDLRTSAIKSSGGKK